MYSHCINLPTHHFFFIQANQIVLNIRLDLCGLLNLGKKFLQTSDHFPVPLEMVSNADEVNPTMVLFQLPGVLLKTLVNNVPFFGKVTVIVGRSSSNIR